MINKSIGLKLRTLRMKRGYSQQNVADDLKISATAYSKIENGRTNITVKRLNQLAEYFSVFAADFLDNRRELPRSLDEVGKLTEKEHQYLNQYFAGILHQVNETYTRGK